MAKLPKPPPEAPPAGTDIESQAALDVNLDEQAAVVTDSIGATPPPAKKASGKKPPEQPAPTGPPTLGGSVPARTGVGTAAASWATLPPASLPGLSETKEFVSIGYYGDPGTGKTSNAAAMANLGRVCYINAEGGLKPTALRKRGINVDNIKIWPNREAGEQFTFDGLERLFFQLQADLLRDPGSWVGSVWDSLTEISYQFVTNAKMANMTRQQAQGKTVDRWFMDRSFYGVSTSQIQELIRRFRDLPMHFALCALQRRDTDDDGRVSYGPAVNPALATDVPGFVDILCHTEVVEIGAGERGSGTDEYRGWLRQHGKFRAKDRYGVLPKALPDPTFERIVSYVDGTLDTESDPILAAARARAKGSAESPAGESDGQPPAEKEGADAAA